tara:strand:+ start:197 stop:400 length:204 start_codon:yes stop_codon:yes gene_type:complete
MNEKIYKLLLEGVLQYLREGIKNCSLNMGTEFFDFRDMVCSIHEGEADLTEAIVDRMKKDIYERLSL